MKKNLFKKVLTSTATIFAVAAVAAPNVNVFAADTPTINASPATKLDTPAASVAVFVNKDIVLFNVDGALFSLRTLLTPTRLHRQVSRVPKSPHMTRRILIRTAKRLKRELCRSQSQ